jgi:hypothetical protein
MAALNCLWYVQVKYYLIPTFLNGSVSLQPHHRISLTLPEDLERTLGGTSPHFYDRKDEIGGL